ncbi:uncharacterized protein LOC133178365 [Saccostrea echinata]|uniref:uncharacterized protein LOC133178365 n=1 Tax=Saccostrea echinata TaxID=191078 RepID=UPI002A80CBC0|nr:uncharacterized protein LOC133178365 [Saccostrea echinata]
MTQIIRDFSGMYAENAKKNDKEAEKILSTAKFDARFQLCNQDKLCWQNYVDYHRCIKKKGEDYEPCNWFKKQYTSICPSFWTERWDDALENGAFPAKI